MAKKKGNGVLAWIMIIVFLLISGSLIIFFNIGGIRDIAFSLINKRVGQEANTSLSAEEIQIEKEKEFINAEKAKLSALRTDLENFKAQLENRGRELDEKEEQLALKEQEVEQLMDKLSQQFHDLTEVVKIYEKMDGEEAAAILSEIEDTDQLLLIIKNLNKEKSAEILGLMDAKKAADILSRLY